MDNAANYTVIDGFRCYAPELTTAYDDYPSDGFDLTVRLEAESFWCRTRNRVLRSILRKFVGNKKTAEMLEIGCGTGTVLGALRTLPFLRLTGSEVYLQGLKHARRRLPDVEFIQLDATNIPFEEAYDVVGAFDVIEHIDADERVMREVRKALRPGGLFVITVPQYPWMWSRLDELVHHKRRYTRKELIGKLESAGYEVLYQSSFVTMLFPFMMTARLLDSLRRTDPGADADQELEARVSMPRPLNFACDWIMRIDEAALSAGLSLPFGGSLLAVARKPESPAAIT